MTEQTYKAGWYKDHSNPAQQRYFDGTQWTEQVRPVPVAAAPVPAAKKTTLMALNPYLSALWMAAALAIVVGVILLMTAEPGPGELISPEQSFGFVIANLGVIAFVGWLVAGAISWHVEKQAERTAGGS